MKLRNPISYLILALLFVYKKILSPILPRACRYTPSCSEYMMEAIKKYGLLKGLKIGFKRLATCHPWGGHGYDPLK